jgi:hypothetical protein
MTIDQNGREGISSKLLDAFPHRLPCNDTTMKSSENWQERRGDESEDCRWTKTVDEYYCSPFVSRKYRWMSFAMCTHTEI